MLFGYTFTNNYHALVSIRKKFEILVLNIKKNSWILTYFSVVYFFSFFYTKNIGEKCLVH